MKRMSLGKRLNLMSFVLIVPMTALVIYLLISLLAFCNAYSQMVSNIDETNAYCSYFKEDIDYVMYREVIGAQTYRQIYAEPEKKRPFGWEQMKDPYKMIDEAQATFQRLETQADGSASENDIRWIIHSLGQLKSTVRQIDSGIESGGSYSDNNEQLQLGVYILTNDIQDKIRDYVYQEALSFQKVQNTLNERGVFAVRLSVVLLVAIVALSLWISRSITRSVAVPIRNLCRATRRIAKGDFTHKTSVESSDELAILADSVNRMQEEIGRLISNINAEQNKRRIMELQLLQEQINPHFLYNTLDTIVWLAEGRKNEQVVSMVASLSTFFHSMLSGGRDFVTIEEETRHVSSYLEIQQVRYQDIMTYELHIDEALYPYSILKLTLQPLIENALYHGIKKKRGTGRILVNGRREGGDAVFEVVDDGIGMAPGEQERLRASIQHGGNTQGGHGFGLANVDERLRLHYGDAYGLSFTSAPGLGTTFTIRVPLQTQAKNNDCFSNENHLLRLGTGTQ